MAISKTELKTELFKILEGKNLETLTRKKARKMLEKELGLEENGLKPRKDEINEYLVEYCSKQQQEAEESEKSEESSASSAPASRKRERETKESTKAKKAKTTDEKKEPKNHTCVTRSGNAAPKQLKQRQQDIMTTAEFMEKAKELKLEIFGNKLTGKPRSFSSNNKGWYLGGKIEVDIGGTTVWASAGINISIVGSKEWED
jgi:hypothetical protein